MVDRNQDSVVFQATFLKGSRQTHAFFMFVDMRGSTKLSEVRLPFAIVFLINQFVESASQAITDARWPAKPDHRRRSSPICMR